MSYEQEQKKTFRLEDGTQVAGSEEIYRAYESSRNHERYLGRQQKWHTSFSLSDDLGENLTAADDTENDFDRNSELRILRQAIATLTVREQGIIDDYFFNGYSFRTLGKKYGVSHTKIHSEFQTALSKLRQYIMDKIG